MNKAVKKTEKKLVLTQSRVRRLSNDQLSGVVGGDKNCDPTKVRCTPGGSACDPTRGTDQLPLGEEIM